MTDEDDFGSAGYDRVTALLTGVITAIHDRPGDALMLMKEAYAIYRFVPAHERKLLDETFQLVAAEMDQGGKPH
jgi:hypothetical protein